MVTTAAAPIPRPPPSWVRGVTAAGVASLALHVAVVAWIAWRTELPDVGFELSLPMDVELGMTEAVRVAPTAPPQARPPSTAPPPATHAAGLGAAADGGVPGDASVDGARPRHHRPRDAGADGDSELVASAGADGGVQRTGVGDAAGDREGLAAYAPPGAQLALRLDMAKIRASRLAPDVRALLSAIPDWQALLAGSDIDPLDDLDRLMIATPNLQRSRLVMSGRYAGDEAKVRAAVASLAAARGVTAEWRTERGIDVAPWPNDDETERVVALVGPQEFTITRPEDLPRVLSIAHARLVERRGHDAGAADDADALLAMGEGDVLDLDVEGARRFVRGPTDDVPERMHLGVRQLENGRASVSLDAFFESPERASEARDFWDGMRQRTLRSPWVALLGLDAPLAAATLETDGATVHAHTELGERELRLLLGFARGLFPPRGAPPPATSDPSMALTPPPAQPPPPPPP